MVAFEIPADFYYTFLSVAIVYITNIVLGGRVGGYRKKHNFKPPAMYMAPNEKGAADYNAAQRGHQNMIETQGPFLAQTILIGLFDPFFAFASSAAWCVGRVGYALGYQVRPGARVYGEVLFLGAIAAQWYKFYTLSQTL
eukprot:TRINITY_DN3720_c0_g1_i1.p2 TRINITY_DN3720_c0_g1~~TRINITY_DN3720_c0_g1_i1.p2  ORF type:complete len:156 (-),score=38.53 TRINITY_DN3720_c0_g1_i1:1801-2220(-)